MEIIKPFWQTYEILSQKFPNIKVIDGEKSIQEVFEEVKSKIDSI